MVANVEQWSYNVSSAMSTAMSSALTHWQICRKHDCSRVAKARGLGDAFKLNVSDDTKATELVIIYRAVVVAQLVERLLPTPEVRGSTPVIGKLLYRTFICLLSTVLKRRK